MPTSVRGQYAHVIHLELCLNLSRSNMPLRKVELCFMSSIPLCEMTIFIHLLSSSRYHTPCQGEHAYIIRCTHCFHIMSSLFWCNNCSGQHPCSSHLFACFGRGWSVAKNSIPRCGAEAGTLVNPCIER